MSEEARRDVSQPRAEERAEFTNGAAAASVLAAGIGSLALGFFTVVVEASEGARETLNLYDPVGPLSGKTTFAVVVWLAGWVVLHLAWRGKQVSFGMVFAFALVLIALGFIGTFPPFFEVFSYE